MKSRVVHLKSGFTLIELLIVITISGLLILTGIFTFGKALKQLRLEMLSEEVATSFEFAKNSVRSGDRNSQAEPQCRGLGFDTASNSYSLVSMPYLDGLCVIGEQMLSENIVIPSGIEIVDIEHENGIGSDDSFMVILNPPNAKVKFYSAQGDPNEALSISVTFAYTGSDYPVRRTVTIYSSGQVNY